MKLLCSDLKTLSLACSKAFFSAHASLANILNLQILLLLGSRWFSPNFKELWSQTQTSGVSLYKLTSIGKETETIGSERVANWLPHWLQNRMHCSLKNVFMTVVLFFWFSKSSHAC